MSDVQPSPGDILYDHKADQFFIWDGTEWKTVLKGSTFISEELKMLLDQENNKQFMEHRDAQIVPVTLPVWTTRWEVILEELEDEL